MAETQSLPSIQQLHPHPLSQHALSPMHHRDHTSSFRPPQPQPLQHLPPSANPAEAETQPQHPQHPQQSSILPVIYPAANPASTQHYPPNGLPPIDGLSNGHHRILYPILPQAGKDMRPPKREIKRRTKTGCMTCRKRRIKCDEGHPACRNCQKSKRECLGYDPIFKPQGPNAAQMREDASIVTVPQATPEPRPSLTEGQTTVYPTLHHHPYPPPIPAYNGQQARHVDATAPAPQPLSAIHDYIRSPSSQSPNMDHTSTSIKSDPDSTPPVASSLATQASAASATEMRQTRKDLRIRIDDLFLSKDAKTDALPTFERLAKPPTEEELEEIKGSYLTQYAPALNAFFETSWYTVHGGRFLLYRESDIPFYQHCATMFKARMPDPTLETRLIWLYVCLPRLSWEMHKTATPELADLLHRVDVVENLLTGSILPVNLIPPAPPTPRNPPPNAVPTPEFISHSFWHHLGYFSAQDDTSPDFNPGSSACLNMTSSMVAMRQLLLVLENRDVLFSVAIARHFGGRLKHFDEKTLPIGRTQDSEEAQNKFAVAWGFLTREEVDGTTPVVRGIAGMGRRGVLLHHGGGKETRPTTAESV